MDTILSRVIEKSFALRAKGMTAAELSKAHFDRARELGVSLSKYYESNEGKEARDVAIACETYERAIANSNGDGYGGTVNKIREVEIRKVRENKEPFAMTDDGDDLPA